MLRMLMIAFGLIVLFHVSTATALTIRPECAKMRDKVGCTCALNNGGGISPTGNRWYSVRGRKTRNGGMFNQTFIECNKHQGNF